MTWKELIIRQQKELFEQALYSLESRDHLYAEQRNILQQINTIGQKEQEIIRRVFSEQVDQWREKQNDEWHVLLNVQECQRDAFRKEQLIQQETMALLRRWSPEKERSR